MAGWKRGPGSNRATKLWWTITELWENEDVSEVVMTSGGIGSWATAKRVVEKHGAENVTLLFADTRIEDDDLYRFLRDAVDQLGAELVTVTDGRTPWQVFHDVRFLGNTRIAACSHKLKQEPCRKWLEANCDPITTTIHVGIDWTEQHRLPAIRRGYEPWQVEAPLCDPPHKLKQDLIADARAVGLDPPRLYRLGFAHNNCGGGCVRGGQAQWAHLLRTFPERYATWEREEESLRAELGDIAILRDRTGGEVRPLTLREFRESVEAGNADQDELDFDWGGCGCLPGDAA